MGLANTIQIEEIENDLQALGQRYRAAQEEARLEPVADRKFTIEQRARKILDEMAAKEDRITELRQSARGKPAPNPTARREEDTFYKIDFYRVEEITGPILKRLQRREEHAALFLLPAAKNRIGEYWTRRLEDWLSEVSSKIVHRRYSPEDANECLDAETLLRWIGRELLDDEQCIDAPDADLVITRLSESLREGILFIHFRFYDTLSDNDDLLRWLVEDFWRKLVDKLRPKRRQVRVVMAIVAVNELAEKACAHPVFCGENEFDPCRILRLPLEEWTVEMIEAWVIDHSGLLGMPDHANFDARQFAEQIHAEGKHGKPHYVDDALRKSIHAIRNRK